MKCYLLKKNENLKSVATEFERTQKKLRLLNNSINKLDHLITIINSFGDHSSVVYKAESSTTKIVFVKSGFLNDSVSISVNKAIMKSIATKNKYTMKQSAAIGKFVSNSRQQ